MAQHAAVRPARHTRVDLNLATNVRGIHGYEAYCACGWEGECRKTWGEAQFDARLHRQTEHRLPWEPVGETHPASPAD